MKFYQYFILLVFLIIFQNSNSQHTIEQFLKPADSLNVKRLKTVAIAESALATASIVGLNALWYSNYPKRKFHFKNDNADWLQMDKAGHVFSSYQLGKLGADALKWSGADQKNQIIYGATLGFAYLAIIEVFDGHSAEWGASIGDVVANGSGTALYISQELLWKEQRIIPKFSFHTTSYASARPEVLGSSFSEQILKDYNGQTYWLSANLHSFFHSSIMPKWLNLAVGYGADGMLSGNNQFNGTVYLNEKARMRQYYLSFDVDLSKIKTNSSVLRTFFSVFNSIKIPAPAVELTSRGDFKFHYLYF